MKILKILSIVSISIVLMWACSKTDNNKETENIQAAPSEKEIVLTTEQFTSSGMKLGRITPQYFSEEIRATGMMQVPPKHKAVVSVYYGGTVKDVHLLEGQRVKKGAVLFSMENPDYVQMQQDYLRVKSKLKYLQAEYQRQKKLLAENVTSRKKYLKAESDYLTMLADFNALSKKLRLLNMDPTTLTYKNITTFAEIKAPIDGFITQVNITKGQHLSPNEVAVSIVGTQHLHLELNVFEKDITKIKKGQTIQFFRPENEAEHYEGEVFLIGHAVNPSDRTINVHGHLKNEESKRHFIPGMYIEAKILVNNRPYPALPSNAVVNLDNKNYILVKKSFDNNRYTFVQKFVKIGMKNERYTQILNAEEFQDSDILVKGAFQLIE